jgi:hypothetical protein
LETPKAGTAKKQTSVPKSAPMTEKKMPKSTFVSKRVSKDPPKTNKNQVLYSKMKTKYTKEMQDAVRNGEFETYLDEYCCSKELSRKRVFRNVVDRALMQQMVYRAMSNYII